MDVTEGGRAGGRESGSARERAGTGGTHRRLKRGMKGTHWWGEHGKRWWEAVRERADKVAWESRVPEWGQPGEGKGKSCRKEASEMKGDGTLSCA